MKIRNKINLWITALGLLINLILAGIILFEAVELPYETLDEELEAEVRQDIAKLIAIERPTTDTTVKKMMTNVHLSKVFDFDERYWIKVFDPEGREIYSSDIAKKITIPHIENDEDEGYTIHIPFSEELASKEEYREIVPFRVNLFTIHLNNERYIVQIARAVDEIDREVDELIHIVVIGFIVAAVVLVLLSSFLTDKILEPIVKINQLAEKISVNDMAGRIPLGKSKDELYDLSNALNSMFDRLEKSFLAQKQLIADAAHELKSPITMISLFMERSMEQSNMPKDYLDRLNSQIQILRRMSRLVKDLLEISRLDLKESLHCKRFDFEEMVNLVLEDFEPLFDEHRIVVHTKIPKRYHLTGDKEKMMRLLINLVDNAVKYNRPDGTISIGLSEVLCGKRVCETRALKRKNNLDVSNKSERFSSEKELPQKGKPLPAREIHLSVWNSGIGIPTQDLVNVFKTFYRVEKSRSQKYGGAGLGLTIVDKIVRLHGGAITMESDPGKWCRATVILPLIND